MSLYNLNHPSLLYLEVAPGRAFVSWSGIEGRKVNETSTPAPVSLALPEADGALLPDKEHLVEESEEARDQEQLA